MTNAMQKFYAFLDRPLRPWSRFVLAGLVVFMALAFTAPMWRISMKAPQYPDGLYMDVWAYKLVGGNHGEHIQEINTLNHYIGMHHIEPHSFADLDWIPFALGILMLLTLRVAAIGSVRSLVDLSVLTGYVLAFMGARFVYRLWVFGHDLDPRAPIHVKPFMPVVFGTKQIANFTTHSLPQLGTLWITIFAVGVVGICLFHLLTGRRAAKATEIPASAGKTTPAVPGTRNERARESEPA